MKKVSMIVPCYNVENYVRECMDSLIGQSIGVEELEIIAVDDASTDGTLAILQEYEQRFPESVMLIPLPENNGPGYVRNIALAYATGEYVMYADSDDWLDTGAVEKLYNKIKKFDAEVLEFGFFRAGENGCRADRLFDGRKCRMWNIDSALERKKFSVLGIVSGVAWNKIYKASFLKEHQLVFAEGLRYEDTLFTMLLLLSVKKYALYPEPFYFYRINGQGIMLSCPVNDYGQFDRAKVQVAMLRQCEERKLLEPYYDIIEANFVRVYYVETLVPVVERFEHLPAKEVRELQRTVRALFPNWKNNELLKLEHNRWMEKWLTTIEVEFDERLFQELKKQG